MKEKLEKYQVIVYLILVILIMLIIKIKYSSNTDQVSENIPKVVLPTLTLTPTVFVDKDYPLKDKLPYQGNGFVIEKYIEPMTLNLKLTTATQQEAAKDITVWLDAFGELGSGHILQLEEATTSAITPVATVSDKKVATPTKSK